MILSPAQLIPIHASGTRDESLAFGTGREAAAAGFLFFALAKLSQEWKQWLAWGYGPHGFFRCRYSELSHEWSGWAPTGCGDSIGEIGMQILWCVRHFEGMPDKTKRKQPWGYRTKLGKDFFKRCKEMEMDFLLGQVGQDTDEDFQNNQARMKKIRRWLDGILKKEKRNACEHQKGEIA